MWGWVVTNGFGDRLRAARRACGLTQAKLGEMTGIHQTAISFIERAVRNPSMEKVVTLCNALGSSADYLLGRTDDPKSKVVLPQSRLYLSLTREHMRIVDMVITALYLAEHEEGDCGGGSS